MAVIRNAANTPLNANAGNMPNVSSAIAGWFQPMTFGVVTKTPTAFQAVETVVQVSFQGVWQPLAGRDLALKPEGERKWNWFWLHADPSLTLNIDDIVTYLGVQYRVMKQKDWRLDSYVEYHLVEDFTGSGPTETTP